MTTLYDETQWEVEPADYSVGIFGDTWVHETCPKEYDEGVQMESTLAGRFVEKGAVYADETTTLTCLDCGATTSFTGRTLIGFEGEQGV